MQTIQTKRDWVAVADELGPAFAERASAHDADDSFVTANYDDLKAAKVFAAGVPAELGGGDASLAELCDILRTFAHYCSSTALALSMQTHQVAIPTWRWRHEQAPVDGLLKRVAAEQIVLISTGGSDWLNGSGKAERVDGGYRVSGRKIFGSGSPSGTLLMTTAVFEDPDDGPTVLHMPIPIASEGVRVLDNWRTMGMRATGSNDIVIEDVFVPESAIGVRRPKGKWHRFMHIVVMNAFPLIYSVYVGVAEAARNLALRETTKKRDDPNVQYLVGEMEDELAGAQFALRHMVDVAMTSQPEAETTNRIMIGRALGRPRGDTHRREGLGGSGR